MNKRIVFQLGVYYLQQEKNLIGATATNVSNKQWETIGQTKDSTVLNKWKKAH